MKFFDYLFFRIWVYSDRDPTLKGFGYQFGVSAVSGLQFFNLFSVLLILVNNITIEKALIFPLAIIAWTFNAIRYNILIKNESLLYLLGENRRQKRINSTILIIYIALSLFLVTFSIILFSERNLNY